MKRRPRGRPHRPWLWPRLAGTGSRLGSCCGAHGFEPLKRLGSKRFGLGLAVAGGLGPCWKTGQEFVRTESLGRERFSNRSAAGHAEDDGDRENGGHGSFDGIRTKTGPPQERLPGRRPPRCGPPGSSSLRIARGSVPAKPRGAFHRARCGGRKVARVEGCGKAKSGGPIGAARSALRRPMDRS